MTIKKALEEIVAELRNVRDLRSVPDAPPESNKQFPFAIVYPASGEFQKQSAGWANDFHDINIELHVARKDLPRNFAIVVDVYDQIPNQLDSGLEAGRFSTIKTWGGSDGSITYTFGPLEYAGVETLGVVYTMPRVKLHRTVST